MKRFTIAALMMLGAACKSESAPAPDKAPAAPVRVAITASDEGYTPSTIAAHVGQPVTLVFTRTTTSSCLDKVLIPTEKVDKELPVNQPVEITFTPTKTGTIEFTCGMEMFRGEVKVD